MFVVIIEGEGTAAKEPLWLSSLCAYKTHFWTISHPYTIVSPFTTPFIIINVVCRQSFCVFALFDLFRINKLIQLNWSIPFEHSRLCQVFHTIFHPSHSLSSELYMNNIELIQKYLEMLSKDVVVYFKKRHGLTSKHFFVAINFVLFNVLSVASLAYRVSVWIFLLETFINTLVFYSNLHTCYLVYSEMSMWLCGFD